MIDRNTGLSYCDGDEEFYLSVLEDFADESAEKMTRLKACLKAEDLDGYRILVHSLISTGKLIGAMELARLAAEQQKAADEKDINLIRSSCGSLTEEYEGVVREIRQILGSSENN